MGWKRRGTKSIKREVKEKVKGEERKKTMGWKIKTEEGRKWNVQ